jgi:hypothetical protein
MKLLRRLLLLMLSLAVLAAAGLAAVVFGVAPL